ncbi:hypothetical protein OAV88_00370 [bacterium]|nr:hypothetical protein [bacterium]
MYKIIANATRDALIEFSFTSFNLNLTGGAMNISENTNKIMIHIVNQKTELANGIDKIAEVKTEMI